MEMAEIITLGILWGCIILNIVSLILTEKRKKQFDKWEEETEKAFYTQRRDLLKMLKEREKLLNELEEKLKDKQDLLNKQEEILMKPKRKVGRPRKGEK